RRHQRRRRQPLVIAVLEERQEELADLVRGHQERSVGAIVPCPSTTSPASKHAICPGATPKNPSPSSSSSASWRPAPTDAPTTRHGTGRDRYRSFTAPTSPADRCSPTSRTTTLRVPR